MFRPRGVMIVRAAISPEVVKLRHRDASVDHVVC
jgi:hypothetical protein